MSSWPSRLNEAQDVRPMGGVIFTPAMTTERSLRGTETLNTPSFSSRVPLAPVSRSILPVSIFVAEVCPIAMWQMPTMETASHAAMIAFLVLRFIDRSLDEGFIGRRVQLVSAEGV